MTPERFKNARALSLPADFEGHSEHRAPATAVALGEALDEIERLQTEVTRLTDGMTVCACFMSKPCPCCIGEGTDLDDDSDDPAPCGACKGSGRKRGPKCQKCIDEGKP